MNKTLLILALIYNLVISVILLLFLYAYREYKEYRTKYEDTLMANTIIMRMDDSCFTQFKNNMDKSFNVKFYFEK
jgi:hypothetical protein